MNFKSDNVGSGNFKNYFFQIMLGVVQAISQTNAKPEQLFQVNLVNLAHLKKKKILHVNRFGLDNLEIRKTSATQIGQPRKDTETKCSCYETNW
jgi:hypothetical protein